jgi:hypothetical protein
MQRIHRIGQMLSGSHAGLGYFVFHFIFAGQLYRCARGRAPA